MLELALKDRAEKYFRENLGAPFIITFMVTLMLSSVLLIMVNEDYANAVAVYGYFILVIGVILRIVFPEAIKRVPRKSSAIILLMCRADNFGLK